MTRLFLALAAPLAMCLVVLAVRPHYDLDVASLFYVGHLSGGPGRFVGQTPAGIALRYVLWAIPFILLGGLLLATGLARAGLLRRGPTLRSATFLVLTIALGPGLIVHTAIKEHAHRPRPTMVTDFGGADRFRPFLRFDGACRGDCSFPSGEAALASWTLAPASLAPPPWRAAALGAAVALTAATAVWRMALGGHFLSDVCGAALIVILVVLGCRALLIRAPTRE